MNILEQAPPPPMSGADKPAKRKKVSFGKIAQKKGLRIGLYGAAGVGKTTLASTSKGKKVFFDLDDSLPILQEQLTPDVLDTISVVSADSWNDIIESLQADGWGDIKTIIIDTLTKAEEMCVKHLLSTVPNDKGKFVQRIDDYGFGKGYAYLYDCFLPLLSELDKHCAEGRNVILVMHDCTSTVPNPAGDDFLRYEPRLSNPASGKCSIRLRVREWLDHLFWLGLDRTVDSAGKATGGNRILIPSERPFCMAKSRKLSQDIEFSNSNPIDIL